ncbi:hypothetical protein [Streptomyces sp. NPDC003710]
MNNLAIRLAGLGRREDALTAIDEAVTTYRELAAAHPDVHQAALEQALRVLSLLQDRRQ